MIRYLMKKKGVASLEDLIALSADLGVKFNVCTMSMDLLGLQRDELIDYPDLNYCGVATFVESAARSKTSLFL
jgi:peroxiredoxin family protein